MSGLEPISECVAHPFIPLKSNIKKGPGCLSRGCLLLLVLFRRLWREKESVEFVVGEGAQYVARNAAWKTAFLRHCGQPLSKEAQKYFFASELS